ncbi:MAG TPA: matrixin family metalloprotease, partial [Gemmataceae bacterium]|nr:matrixin family metalloprotease [Gemmataceae bacterium]
NTITFSYSGDTNFLASDTSLTVSILSSILVLDPAATGALSLSGNASITEPGNVVVDSNVSAALQANGNANLKALSIQVVGGASRTGNASLSPVPVTGAAFVADPLAGLAAPSVGVSQGSVDLTHGALTLNPGTYSSIKVSGSAALTLNPGIYILAGGGLTVSGNASISGNRVLLYNTGSNFPNPGGNFGGITLSGNGGITLSAASTGAYVGVVIFQSHANTRALSLSGNSFIGLTGVIYTPSAQVIVSGNAQLNAPLVVDRLTLSGNGVSTQTSQSSSAAQDTASAGTLLAGDLRVYVSDPAGYFTSNDLVRIQDAISRLDSLLVPYNVIITEVADSASANLVIDNATTSAAGSYADGVLGSYGSSGEITIIQGWNWYDGADPTQIGSDQYDIQTVVTHELGHALGLGGSSDPNSVMYESLSVGVTRRVMSVGDLNIPDPVDGADPERAALSQAGEPLIELMSTWESAQELRGAEGAVMLPHTGDGRSSQADTLGFGFPGFPTRGTDTNPFAAGQAGSEGRAESATAWELSLLCVPDLGDWNDGMSSGPWDSDQLPDELVPDEVRDSTEGATPGSDQGGGAKHQEALAFVMQEWPREEHLASGSSRALPVAGGSANGHANRKHEAPATELSDAKAQKLNLADLLFAAVCITSLTGAPRDTTGGRKSLKEPRADWTKG